MWMTFIDVYFVTFNLVSYLGFFVSAGASSLQELYQMCAESRLKFEFRSPAAQREGAVHSLHTYDK